MKKEKLPNATAVLVLGIVSIVTCCCYGIIGLIIGIVALVLAGSDMKLYRQDPERYSDYNNLNIGRILAIIGTVLSSVVVIILAYVYITVGPKGLQEIKENLEARQQFEQQE